MDGWGKIVAGAGLGVVGTVYATNEEFRKQLPKNARDLPVAVRRRFDEAVSAAREASSSRRQEILRDLEDHGGGAHAARGVEPDPGAPETSARVSSAAETPVVVDPDATQQISRPTT
ncbi:MAG TPA: hypothetical protein VHM16_03625 [Rubrobacteraceae bacterium]|nr:hypothetical protein [Rubrobacteraceae bacterium]